MDNEGCLVTHNALHKGEKKKVESDSGCTAMGGAPQCVGTPAYLVPESGPPI